MKMGSNTINGYPINWVEMTGWGWWALHIRRKFRRNFDHNNVPTFLLLIRTYKHYASNESHKELYRPLLSLRKVKILSAQSFGYQKIFIQTRTYPAVLSKFSNFSAVARCLSPLSSKSIIEYVVKINYFRKAKISFFVMKTKRCEVGSRAKVV